MQGSKKIPINDLNQHITCKICNGYFIDATTIIECLHTFCRSCIVKYLENNRYCPVCDVQVHKTKPLLNIRPDKTLQDIVYKLVPRLFQNEMQKRREFYENHPESKPSTLEMCGEAAYQHLLTPEESICLTLSYYGSTNTPRYLRCPAAVSLGHLKKLIRAKYDLNDNHRVEILYNQDCLNSSLTLMDVAYIYMWKRKAPMELTYKIYKCSAKKLKPDPDNADPTQAHTNNNNWKEVQLRISESGEMSITGIQEGTLAPSLLEIVNSDQQKYKNDLVTIVESKSVNKTSTSKKELPGLKYIGKNTNPPVSNANPSKTATTESKTNDSAIVPSTLPEVPVTKSTIPDSLRLERCVSDSGPPAFLSNCATLSSGTTTMVFSTINSSKCSTKTDDAAPRSEPPKTDGETSRVEDGTCGAEQHGASLGNSLAEKGVKRKNDDAGDGEPAVKQPKQTILNHSLGLLNLSNNHPLKKHSKLNRNGESVKEIVLRSSTPIPEPSVTIITKVSTASTKTITTTSATDSTFSKPNVVNKILTSAQVSRPGTPITTTKPVATSAKPPTSPSKPLNVYAGAAKSPCYMPKTTYNPIINVPKPAPSSVAVKTENKPSGKNVSITTVANKVGASASSTAKPESKASGVGTPQQSQQQQPVNLNSKMAIKSKPSTPIGYKTLRDPPKSWNSQISKANVAKPSPDSKQEMKNIRPAKFFKMRNNMPRYLGNPASGVKPMYQVHVSPEKDKSSQEANKTEKSEIRKHSIVKIDPKTLKPISEKAPETTSLSNHSSCNQILSNPVLTNHNSIYQNANSSCSGQSLPSLNAPTQSDLKINTSSVSIFNPLKLQSSPKNDRRSPKSPHSPKLKAQPTNSSTSGKRDKVNLNFTPPNPFVPNLASPTISPNQFLYPTGPPGFPTYDPRMMAAYHSLWYGQRMAFPASPMPRLSLDINQQRKNFEMMPSPTSPKMAGINQQGHSPQSSSKLTSTTSTNAPSVPKTHNQLPPAVPKPTTGKKSQKEAKNEKSLETTVEKLTQNRNKEIKIKNDTSASIQSSTPKSNGPEKEDATKSGASDKAAENASDRVHDASETTSKESTSAKVADDTQNSSSSSKGVTQTEGVSDKDAAQLKSTVEAKSREVTDGGSSVTPKKESRSDCGGGDAKTDVTKSEAPSKELSNNVDSVKSSQEVAEG